jgi:hypothetical protein
MFKKFEINVNNTFFNFKNYWYKLNENNTTLSICTLIYTYFDKVHQDNQNIINTTYNLFKSSYHMSREELVSVSYIIVQ